MVLPQFGAYITIFKIHTCYDPAVAFLRIFLAEILVHVYKDFHRHIERDMAKNQTNQQQTPKTKMTIIGAIV